MSLAQRMRLLGRYEEWVRENSAFYIPALEFAKSATMFMPGRYDESLVSGEAIYSSLNLITHYHDGIVDKPRSSPSELMCGREAMWISPVKQMLTFFEFTEVLLEMMATKYYLRIPDLAKREKSKWRCVFYIEACKAFCRLLLLYNNRGRIVCAPNEQQQMMMIEERKMAREKSKALAEFAKRPLSTHDSLDELRLMYLNAGRSKLHPHGRFALPAEGSGFQAHPMQLLRDESNRKPKSSEIVAEIIYALRPVAFVAAKCKWLNRSWRPFVVSIFMDAISRKLTPRELTPSQQREISRRSGAYFYYLFLSPFFERFTKVPLEKLISLIEKIPFLGGLISGLMKLAISLREHYFYVSMS